MNKEEAKVEQMVGINYKQMVDSKIKDVVFTGVIRHLEDYYAIVDVIIPDVWPPRVETRAIEYENIMRQ
jgi:hypothetical protein